MVDCHSEELLKVCVNVIHSSRKWDIYKHADIAQDPGRSLIHTIVGLLGDTLPCIKLGFSSLLRAQPWRNDPNVIEKPWDEKAYKIIQQRAATRRIAFAVMDHDGIVRPHPPVARALRLVRDALRLQEFGV